MNITLKDKEYNEWWIEFTTRRWKHKDQRIGVYDGGTFKMWHFGFIHVCHLWDYEG
jgi:hypothetical protein